MLTDAESNSKMMKTLLSKIGISAATAENGQVAVDMIMEDKDKFDIVFMDNQMPVMVSAYIESCHLNFRFVKLFYPLQEWSDGVESVA